MNQLIAYCRPGFEKECAAELQHKLAAHDIAGFVRLTVGAGWVQFTCYAPDAAAQALRLLPIETLIFTRQLFCAADRLTVSGEDRITPIVACLQALPEQAGEVRVEVPDTNEGKTLLKFCRKFTVPLRAALRQARLLSAHERTDGPVIHVFFTAPGTCFVGWSLSGWQSPWYMGILRLKLPADAPSRSTLKLEEAFHQFIPASEWNERLAPGMVAVDLGACPGGWTYQLVRRNMRVHAVDHGAIAPSLMETGQVTWHAADGFTWRPGRQRIDWLVCDMVDKPARVTALMSQWLVNGWCREAIFNLKLPMKKRYEAVCQQLEQLHAALAKADIAVQLQARQLYHDREEITVHVRRIWGTPPARRAS